jgi:hypothetical protein
MSHSGKFYSILFRFIIICFLFYNCEKIVSINDNEVDNNYPTILYFLTSDSLQQTQLDFDELNDSKICSRLNEFGLTGHDHCYRNNPQIKISHENDALEIAINTLVKNNKYTNVTNSLALVTGGYTIGYINDEKTHWGIHFEPQQYQGLEVFGTRIDIALFGDGVFNIDGFWYKNIYIPFVDKVNKSSAKDAVIGQSIVWSEMNGESNEFIVTRSAVVNNFEKIVLPLEKENSIELRVAWKIPIQFGSFIGWHIYLDTTTGEILGTVQEFRS